MSLLKILKYPDLRLKYIAKPVLKFDNILKKNINNMAKTMYYYSGIGLAATQVNINQQIIIINFTKNKNNLLVFINPKIIWLSDKKIIFKEGCLSIPGIYIKVQRHEKIIVQYQNIKGEKKYIKTQNILSICIQHEIDHLNGKIFLDYIFK